MAEEKLLLELTSSILRSGTVDARNNLTACRECAEKYGFKFGIQLHNSFEKVELELAQKYDILTSCHAPNKGDYTLNLAMKDADFVFDLFDENAKFMRSLSVNKAVFHGFTMTDLPIAAFGRGKSYDQCMSEHWRPELCSFADSPHARDFSQDDEFIMRFERVKNRLAELNKRYPDLMFCIENDFPAYSSANLFPQKIIELDHPLCLDTGHLWASSLLLGYDFIAAAEQILESKLVKMVHFHSSIMTSATPKNRLLDGHRTLAGESEMPLKRFLKAALNNSVKHFVLEIPQGAAADVEIFGRMVDEVS